MTANPVKRSFGRRSSHGPQPIRYGASSKKPRARSLTCKREVSFIDDYLAATLDPQLSQGFDAHLKACPDCGAFLATYRKTVEITRAFLKLQSLKQEPRRLTLRPRNKAFARR